VQITGPTPTPQQAPAAPVDGGITVDPRLKAIADEIKARQDRRDADVRANARRSIVIPEFGEKGTTQAVGDLVEILRRAFSAETGTGLSGLAKDVVEGNIREQILVILGLFPEGIPIVAGELLGALLNAGPLGSGEEAHIADQELIDAIKRQKPELNMQPMWLADP
jgi:hypothetical protein